MFSLRPGELSPIVHTSFGYHIIRVDRVQPSEVKARHILIAPVIDSTDVHVALLRADSVADKWRKGVPFDSLVAKYHDPGRGEGRACAVSGRLAAGVVPRGDRPESPPTASPRHSRSSPRTAP